MNLLLATSQDSLEMPEPLRGSSELKRLPDQLQEVIRRYVLEHGGDPYLLPQIDAERFAMLLSDTRRMLFDGGIDRPRTPQEFIHARQVLEFLEHNLEYLSRVFPGKAERIRDLLLGMEESRLCGSLTVPPRPKAPFLPPLAHEPLSAVL